MLLAAAETRFWCRYFIGLLCPHENAPHGRTRRSDHLDWGYSVPDRSGLSTRRLAERPEAVLRDRRTS